MVGTINQSQIQDKKNSVTEIIQEASKAFDNMQTETCNVLGQHSKMTKNEQLAAFITIFMSVNLILITLMNSWLALVIMLSFTYLVFVVNDARIIAFRLLIIFSIISYLISFIPLCFYIQCVFVLISIHLIYENTKNAINYDIKSNEKQVKFFHLAKTQIIEINDLTSNSIDFVIEKIKAIVK